MVTDGDGGRTGVSSGGGVGDVSGIYNDDKYHIHNHD